MFDERMQGTASSCAWMLCTFATPKTIVAHFSATSNFPPHILSIPDTTIFEDEILSFPCSQYVSDLNEEYIKREIYGESNIDIIVKVKYSNGEIIEKLRNILVDNYSKTIRIWRCEE